VLASLALTAGVIVAGILVHLNVEVTSQFEGRLWKLPSRIYSDSLVVHPGSAVSRSALTLRLDRMGYVRSSDLPDRAGEYRLSGRTLEAYLRPLDTPWDQRPARRVRVRFWDDTAYDLRDADGRRLREVVFEPELIATLFGPQQEDREVVALGRVPRGLLQAVLAAEDARFYRHPGVDPLAMTRAALANVKSRRIVQGGSTITQQTVKNLYLGQERTWWRKIREIPMAAVLDWRYPKDRILEVYLNEVYLGQRGTVAICGVQAASKFYFGRPLAALTLGEQAMLAGMIRSPGGYNPYRHPERAKARRDQVLDAMARLGFIDDAQLRRARGERLALGTPKVGTSLAPWVVDYVGARLAGQHSRQALSEEGLRVYTTIDTMLQEAAREALGKGLERLDSGAPLVRRQRDDRTLEGLVVVTRPGTGEILAMVGGRDYRRSQFNRATQARRQPGSCFKPFVYLAGFTAEERGRGRGLTPATPLDDAPLELVSGGKRWAPANYDGEFRGIVTARDALEKSLNVPTIRAAQATGLPEVARVAERSGFDRVFRPLPSLALGAQEVTALEMTTAYGTLANGGVRVSPRIIRMVTDGNGSILSETRGEGQRVVSTTSAYLVTHVLQGVMTRGTGKSSQRLGYTGNAAGKTGTTDDTRDAWFVGYTPSVLALVWVGYDDNARTGLTGASGALPIWVDFMKYAGLDGYAAIDRPDDIVRMRIDTETGGRAVAGCPETRIEYFAKGTEPASDCPSHKRGFFKRLFTKKNKRKANTL
jgi:penicillin-binding protein 1B